MPSSLWATAVFRWAGARSAIVNVDGRHPVLLTVGSITCGRLFLRCKTIPIELGAGKHGSLVLGERVFINTGATVVANHSIEIGDDCLIGDLVAIFDTDFHPIEPSRPVRFAPVRLGANVWVGRSATILPGVTIGDHAVIAAESIDAAGRGRHILDLHAVRTGSPSVLASMRFSKTKRWAWMPPRR